MYPGGGNNPLLRAEEERLNSSCSFRSAEQAQGIIAETSAVLDAIAIQVENGMSCGWTTGAVPEYMCRSDTLSRFGSWATRCNI
jgi:hypothetical protein